MMSSPYTPEKENFLRLVTLIHEKGSESMRETLLYFSTNNYGMKTFDDVLQQTTVKDRLKKLKGPGPGRPITSKQWMILYPGTGVPLTVGLLDMTLCFILLKNICNLFPPLNGWDLPPAPDDLLTLEGGLAQLKFIRNMLSHTDNPSLPDSDFQNLFQTAKDAIINIAKGLPKWSVTEEELLGYKNSPINPKQHKDLPEIVKEWSQQEVTEEVSKLRSEVDEIKQQLASQTGTSTALSRRIVEEWSQQEETEEVSKLRSEDDEIEQLAKESEYHTSMLDSKKYRNYMKLVLLIEEKGLTVFREALNDLSTKRHKASSFSQVLQKPDVKKILEREKRKENILQTKWSTLYPFGGKDLGFSLCFALLKSICGLVTPSNTWEKMPSRKDKRSLAGAITSLHFIKTTLAKLSEPQLSDAEFDKHIKSVGEAMVIFKQKKYTVGDITKYETLDLPKQHCIVSTKMAQSLANEEHNQPLIKCLELQKGILENSIEEEMVGTNFMEKIFFNLSKKEDLKCYRQLGLYLKIDNDDITEIYEKNHRDTRGSMLDVLRAWWKVAEDDTGEEEGIKELQKSLKRCGHGPLADAIYKDAMKSINKEKKELEEYGRKLRKRLQNFYIENMSHLCINPLDPDDTMPIESMWVTLNWVKELPQTMNSTKDLKTYSEIFDKEKKRVHTRTLMRILVQGKAGIGKTSFTQKLAVDWANDTVNVLKTFQTIFVLSLRDVDPKHSLVNAISEQLLQDEDVDETTLKKYIQDNERVLIVLDGLDEMDEGCSPEINKIVDRKRLTRVCTLITSRPWKAHALAKSGKKIDTHARILGFTKENRRKFIAYFYSNLLDLAHDSKDVCEITRKLLDEIKENDLEEIAEIPLLLNMLCLLFNDNNSLPSSISEIFKTFRKWLYTRFLKKADIDETDEVVEKYKTTLSKLGRLGLEGLLKPTPQLLFTQKEIIDQVGELGFQVGLISTEKAKAKVNANTKYFFLHKSFQENTSAFLVDSEIRKGNSEPWDQMAKQMTDIKGIRDRDLLLQFCAGESSQTATQILQFLEKKLFEIESGLEELVKVLRTLAADEDLTYQDFNTLSEKYELSHDVRQILDIQASCIINMEEKPTCCLLYHFYTFVATMSTVSKAFHKKALIPRQCFVPLASDEDLEKITHSRIFVSLMSFGSKDNPYHLTETTVQFLFRIFAHSEHAISILFTRVTGKMDTIIHMLDVLKHRNMKNKYLGMDQCQFKPQEWKIFFKCLEKMDGFIGFDFGNTNIPPLGLKVIGNILKQNWKTFLKLDIGSNKLLKGYFCLLSDQLETISNMVLVYLDLRSCISLEDNDHLDVLLQKSKQLEYLNLDWCECNLLNPETKLKKIVHLSLCRNVERQSGGTSDLGSILANLHKFPELKVFKAPGCCIKDKQVQMLKLAALLNITQLDLSLNKLSLEMRSRLEQQAGDLGIEDFSI